MQDAKIHIKDSVVPQVHSLQQGKIYVNERSSWSFSYSFWITIKEKKNLDRNINDISDNAWEVCSSLDTWEIYMLSVNFMMMGCLNMPTVRIIVLVIFQHIRGQESKPAALFYIMSFIFSLPLKMHSCESIWWKQIRFWLTNSKPQC